jgi:hypothetical protein
MFMFKENTSFKVCLMEKSFQGASGSQPGSFDVYISCNKTAAA